ncbi:ScbR family autoregulator-binding transcription factor [Streptomyces sp. NPDC051684]|uniref:ScbR family autoregulator-binding transcription factor n=1 Tax=Streptomyces sp. NPDC051684 TaxID=3365670 RepID=UPI00378EDF9F
MAKQERALRTRTALIASAAEGFAHEGFAVASLTDISRRAGVSNGALHFHFASKADLAAAVEEEASRRLALLTREVRDDGREVAALQDLVDVTHALADALRRDEVLRGGFSLAMEPTYVDGRDLRAQWRQWVDDVLERAHEAGELVTTVRPKDVGIVVTSATVGMEVLGARHPEWLSRQTLTRFWRLLLPRLAGSPAATRVRPEGL